MGIYKYKGQGKTSYQWKLQYKGKTYTGTFDTDSKRKAEEEFALKKAEIRRGILPSKESSTAVLFSDFMNTVPATKGEAAHFKNILREHFGSYYLPQITRRMCEEFRDQRAATPATFRDGSTHPRSPGSVNIEMAKLAKILQAAVEKGYIKDNPCRGMKRLKYKPKRCTIWTKEQAEKALEFMCDDRSHLFPIVLLTLQTGLSWKDVRNLTVSDITLEGDTGILRRVRIKTGTMLDIPLNEIARDILRPLVEGKASTDLVFPSPRTGRAYTSITQALDRVCDLAEVPRITFHKFRHTFATWLIKDGASAQMVARFLGHTNIGTTQIYIQLAAQDLQGVADKAGEWYRQKNVETEFTGLKAVG